MKIITEDDNLIVLNKPSGLVVHPFDYSTEKTVLDFLEDNFPEIFKIENSKKLQDGRTINLGGIVHKLDRETSGVIVVAKNKKTFDALSSLFRNHEVQKTYYAIALGELKEKEFIIDAPLGRKKKDYRRTTIKSESREEMLPAVTEVKVLAHNENYSYLELSPKTGRTHQLRAHLESISHPITGDKVYGNKDDGFKRLMLHAYKLEFILDGQNYSFCAEPPKEFSHLNFFKYPL